MRWEHTSVRMGIQTTVWPMDWFKNHYCRSIRSIGYKQVLVKFPVIHIWDCNNDSGDPDQQTMGHSPVMNLGLLWIVALLYQFWPGLNTMNFNKHWFWWWFWTHVSGTKPFARINQTYHWPTKGYVWMDGEPYCLLPVAMIPLMSP